MQPIGSPRSLVVFILALVIVILLTGTSNAFVSVHAATITAPTATVSPVVNTNNTLTPTQLPTPIQVSADTTGIIILAILIASTVLVGAILGQRRFRKKKAF